MPGKIITVAQQKGGSGKTTLVAHLAVALAAMGQRVALLDVDPQGSLGEWFETRERRVGEGATGLGFRTASGWGARREAASLAREHDIVILDTPPKMDLEARAAIEAASLVVIPMQPTPVDLWASGATLAMVAKERAPVLLVLNRVPPRAALTGEVADGITALGATVADARLGNRIGFASSMGQGRTLGETDKASKGAAEVEALAKEVLDKLR